MIYLTLLIIPLLVALGFLLFGKHRVTFKEFLMHVGAQMLIAGISVGVMYWSNTHDTETWNGRVSGKKQVQVSCSHSYSCNCRTVTSGSGKNQTTSTVCDTCYEHFWDYDWEVYTTNKESFEIDRVDRQGTREPPRWTAVKIGEPTSLKHSYTNYIKAAPDTLFRHQGLVEKYEKSLLTYPSRVYDYHRLDHFVTVVKLDPAEKKAWNNDLAELNADLGKRKQVNIIVVLVEKMPPDYFYALEQHWMGGKKNDVIVAISLWDMNHIDHVHIMAWTDSEIFKVKLRDDILAIDKYHRPDILSAVAQNVDKHYIRKPMEDFEYLQASITPSPLQWAISMGFGLLASIGLGIVFVKQDVV